MPTTTRNSIVLDVMGADCGPEDIIHGGVQAVRNLAGKLGVILVGDSKQIEPILDRIEKRPDGITVQHADAEVPMHISATEGVRMRDSSIAVGLRMVKDGRASAFVSPGNTGAVMATSLLTLGRIEGVSRPAIATVFPTSTGEPCLVLDVGANSDCKPINLSQFALMGSVYFSSVFGKKSPRVGIISIGEERSKGNELILNARQLLQKSQINFVGNIEGRDILSGAVDVAVTDGFTGNILLKFAESIQPLLANAVRRQVQTNIFSRFGVWLMLPFMKRLRDTFDYAESGGAPLLGVNGVVIICHGSSNARAITNAIMVASEMIDKKLNQLICDGLVANKFRRNNGKDNSSQDIRDGVVYSTSGDDKR